MQTVRPAIALVLAALIGACASSGAAGPEGVARLEQAHRDNPTSASTSRSLGIAYFKENRLPEARQSLQDAAKLDPKDGTAQLYLGLTAEAQGDLPAARQAYSSYVNYGRTARVRHLLEERLAALTRKEIEVAAKQEVADESKLGTVPGSPRTVAVLPMKFSGADSSYKPLERGMAELLTTDLSRSSQLTVVERLRVQALLDEMQLQQSGAVDQATGVRAGKMLQAGRLVSGQIQQTGDNLRVDAAIVDVPTSRVVGAPPNDNGTIDQIFTVEKNIALGIFTQLGITLTTAERNAIEQRPTKSLAAFLAYSRGLTLSDEGRYEDANRFFDQAIRLDPSFIQAQQQSQQSHSAAQGQQVTVQTVETTLKGTAEGQVVQGATQGVTVSAGSGGSTASSTASDLNPSTASSATGSGTTTTQTPQKSNPGATGTGTDNVANTKATVVIVIKPPQP